MCFLEGIAKYIKGSNKPEGSEKAPESGRKDAKGEKSNEPGNLATILRQGNIKIFVMTLVATQKYL